MYSEINLDLQAYAKRTYDSILYQSTFYNFLNANYIGVLRQTGAPVVEVAKTNPLSVTKRQTVEIQNDLTIGLATYGRSVVDLTELKIRYLELSVKAFEAKNRLFKDEMDRLFKNRVLELEDKKIEISQKDIMNEIEILAKQIDDSNV